MLLVWHVYGIITYMLRKDFEETWERCKPINVLDHGFVRLIQVGGDDQMICDAARISYANASRSMISDDAKLIDYLMEHHHTSPFEQVVFWFHCKMPIFVARQWVRHRTARLNEFSGRYSEMRDEFHVPELDQLKIQSKTNKQGRDETTVEGSEDVQKFMAGHNVDAFVRYKHLLGLGMAKELARTVLPLSTYTEWYWQMDLHNLFHFLKLRLDSHAQYEIRVYAEAIAKIVKHEVPMAWESFERHVLHAVKFSKDERDILAMLLGQLSKEEVDTVRWSMTNDSRFKSSNNRKTNEFFKKLGLDKPQ